jgi:DNA mismatch repair ATPase MutL
MKTLSLNILDIVQNSVRAKADEISIEIDESETSDQYLITITDNGTGIPGEILETVTDPFVTTRTKRRMGLGLPLLKHHTEITGGHIAIASESGKGTKVIAAFSYSHLDRQPLGDISGVLKILIAANPGISFNYSHRTDNGEYSFNTSETKEYLEVDTLNNMGLLDEIKEMINVNLKDINASGLQYVATF